MPAMRVHELAKEFNMTSKEMLDLLAELNIPAKTHATPLKEESVQEVRKKLSPEIKQRAGELDEAEAAELAKKQAEEKAQKEEEEAKRRAAVEAERKEREAERARRTVLVENTNEPFELISQADDASLLTTEQPSSQLQGLAAQIEAERARVEREKAEAKARARAAAAAAEVAKKREVEERLRQRDSKRTSTKTTAVKASVAKQHDSQVVLDASSRVTQSASTKPSHKFSSLLNQIQAEEQRMHTRSQEAAAPEGVSKSKQHVQDTAQRPRNAKKKGRKHAEVQEVESVITQNTQEAPDRYAQMAFQAEKLQRDKVLAEARAAVAAATSEGEGRRKKRKEKREKEAREKAEQQALERGLDPTLVLDDSVVEIPQGASVSKFAELIGVQPNEVIKRLFMLGQVLTLTQSMSDDLIELIADDLKKKCRVVSPEEEYAVVYHDSDEDLKPRPPVVTVMGHVDHGKTSLLDAIRHSGVAAGEAGGITQHIGASVVNLMDHQITFIDTPGHEAFTAMRARGAQVTDVIILVVAADDGVMPQTIEAINHAKAANVPIVVAVNKIDKDGANPDRVRQELTQYDIVPEEWGGQNMFVNVSAKKNLNVDELLETVLLQADVLGLRANPDALASGFVIEANLDKGRGPVATVLVQRGTLKPGDTVVAGTSYGRVRALINPKGEQVKQAQPAYPVEILGLNSVPTAGDEFRVFEDERDARKLAEERALRARLAEQETKSHMSLDDLFNRIEEGKQTDLNLIIKADVQGSIEALRDAFNKMDQSEVKINIVHAAVGGITETDVTLATASDAIIIGFNVRPTGKSKQLAEKEKVDIRLYRVIYQALEDINAARVGLLKPEIVEKDTGIAEVRDVFRIPKVGNVAGSYIIEGELSRDDKVRIVRDGTVIFEGVLSSLKRFKDDVKSVKQGYECGIGVNGYQDIKPGDTIEGYRIEEVERTE